MLNTIPLVLFLVLFFSVNVFFVKFFIIFYYFLLNLFLKFKYGFLDKKYFFIFCLFLFFGGLTLIFQNDFFIKWKPTVLYWILSSVLLFSYFFKYDILDNVVKKHIIVENFILNYIKVSFSLFFIFLGLLNLYVIYNYDTKTWIFFKIFGTFLFTFIFIVIQYFFLKNNIKFYEKK